MVQPFSMLCTRSCAVVCMLNLLLQEAQSFILVVYKKNGQRLRAQLHYSYQYLLSTNFGSTLGLRAAPVPPAREASPESLPIKDEPPAADLPPDPFLNPHAHAKQGALDLTLSTLLTVHHLIRYQIRLFTRDLRRFCRLFNIRTDRHVEPIMNKYRPCILTPRRHANQLNTLQMKYRRFSNTKQE